MNAMDERDEKLERERALIVGKLREDGAKETLWEAIVLFEGYPFSTVKNLEFRYTVSGARFLLTAGRKQSRSRSRRFSWPMIMRAGSWMRPAL